MNANQVYILALRDNGVTIDGILAWLQQEVKISRSKLYQYLKGWDAQLHQPRLTEEQIEHSVLPIISRTLLSDSEIAR